MSGSAPSSDNYLSTEQSLVSLETEQVNPATQNIDLLSPLDLVRVINAEDARVAQAVAEQAEPIAQAIELIAARLGQGGG